MVGERRTDPEQRSSNEQRSDHSRNEAIFDLRERGHVLLHQRPRRHLVDHNDNQRRERRASNGRGKSQADLIRRPAWSSRRRAAQSHGYGNEELQQDSEVEDDEERAERNHWLHEHLPDRVQDGDAEHLGDRDAGERWILLQHFAVQLRSPARNLALVRLAHPDAEEKDPSANRSRDPLSPAPSIGRFDEISTHDRTQRGAEELREGLESVVRVRRLR